ncbi:MAG: Crp/Fnr family transcriptional regulator [Thermodesulfobacteriota bacterium]
MEKRVDSLAGLGLTDEQSRALAGEMSELQVGKGEEVFGQGDTVKNLYILQRGLIKLVYYTADGKELIKSFIKEGDLFGSLVSQLGEGGATFSAVCIEESSLKVFPYRVFKALIEESPAAQWYALNFFQQLALRKEIREYEFLCLSAETRYRKFLAEYSMLAERITQQDLARYLGITPIALSRIKNR